MEGPCTDHEQQPQDQKLQLLNNLEQEWDFIKKKPDKSLYRTSSASCKTIRYSPGELMESPLEDTAWKVRTNDLAVEEILQERRAAVESGKLKGRRLLEDMEDETEAGFGGNMVSCSGLGVGLVEVRSDFSYESDDNEDENWVVRKEHLSSPYPHCSYSSSSSSSLCAAETLQKGSGTEMATMAETKIACAVACTLRSGKWRLNVFNVCIAISFVMFVVVIISTGSFGVYEDEEVILTPT